MGGTLELQKAACSGLEDQAEDISVICAYSTVREPSAREAKAVGNKVLRGQEAPRFTDLAFAGMFEVRELIPTLGCRSKPTLKAEYGRPIGSRRNQKGTSLVTLLKWGLVLTVFALGLYGATLFAYRIYKIDAVDRSAQPSQISAPNFLPCSAMWIGDSRVAQWPLPTIAGWAVSKVGMSGRGSRAVMEAMRFSPKASPDVVIIQVGINDVSVAALHYGRERDVLIDRAAENIVRAAILAHQQGVVDVFVTSVVPPRRIPAWQWPLYGGAHRPIASKLNRTVARKLKGPHVHFVAVENLVRSTESQPAIHWNAASYRTVNDHLVGLIRASGCSSKN